MLILWKKIIGQSNDEIRCATDPYGKVIYYCDLTGKNIGPAHNHCNTISKEKQSSFIPIIFHNFSNDDCHLFFKTLIDKKPDNKKLNVIPKTNEEYISVTNGCLIIVDS